MKRLRNLHCRPQNIDTVNPSILSDCSTEFQMKLILLEKQDDKSATLRVREDSLLKICYVHVQHPCGVSSHNNTGTKI